jgi:hypothetical protein
MRHPRTPSANDTEFDDHGNGDRDDVLENLIHVVIGRKGAEEHSG